MVAVGLTLVFAAVLSAGLIVALRPLLMRYALARPNARSSHSVPTPQGGGIAVVAATLVAGATGLALSAAPGAGASEIGWLFGATVLLAALGALDDLRPLSPLLRIALQTLCVALVVRAAGDMRLMPEVLPTVIERGLAVLGGVWFVNLVNFMDGIDWMTVAETVPISAAVMLFGCAGFGSIDTIMVSSALLGATLAFAPFNKPVAGLFLGDVGSLPIGLIIAWMLYRLAGAGALTAALLLPLYYVADATLTLLRRLSRGERVWEAHRSHFYQQATDNGFSVTGVVTRVFILNLALAGLAALTLAWPSWFAKLGAVAAGCALVAVVLARFASPRRAEAAA